jgi:flagellar motor switch protein FliN/FliY
MSDDVAMTQTGAKLGGGATGAFPTSDDPAPTSQMGAAGYGMGDAPPNMEGTSPLSHAAGRSPFLQTPGFLLDVRLTVSVEVGRTQMPVRQVMELGPGSVIELPRSASEPVEIFANGRCIGRGEVVVVGEHFGVRITDLGDLA